MSRQISTELKEHFAQDTTTIAVCWKVTRKDGQVFGYTSCDKEIVYDGITYSPAEHVDISSLEQSANGEPDNMEINVAFGTGITKDDVDKGLWDFAAIHSFMINYEDPSQGIVRLVSGNMGEISVEEYGGTFEFRSLTDRLQNTIGRVYDYRCDARLGDSRCTVDLTPHIHFGTVTDLFDRGSFKDTTNANGNGIYAYGSVEFTSGANAGWIREVKAYHEQVFALFEPVPYDIQVGDTYKAIVGCSGFQDTCKNIFNNFVNFRGFPHMPGRDEIIKYA